MTARVTKMEERRKSDSLNSTTQPTSSSSSGTRTGNSSPSHLICIGEDCPTDMPKEGPFDEDVKGVAYGN